MLYPSDLDDCLKQAGLSITDLQADRSIICILDTDSRIVFCNWSWDRFAYRNGGLALSHLYVVGTSVLDITPASLKPFYQTAYAHVRQTLRPWEHDFECSSAEQYRSFRMRILSIARSYLLVENSLRVERPHTHAGGPQPDSDLFVDTDGSLLMCPHCRRTRHTRIIGSPEWVWIPEYLTFPPGRVADELCGTCLRFFYPDRGDGNYPATPHYK